MKKMKKNIKLKRKSKSHRAYINRCHRRGYKPYKMEFDGGAVTAVYGEWIVNQRGSLVAKVVSTILSSGDYRESIGVLGSDGKEYFYYNGFEIEDRGPKPRKRSRKRLLELGKVPARAL